MTRTQPPRLTSYAPWRTTLSWWAWHYQPVVYASALVLGLVGPVFPMMAWATFGLVALGLWAAVPHRSPHCPRCRDAIPLNPRAAVQRHGTALWIYHHDRHLLVGSLGLSFLASLVLNERSSWLLASPMILGTMIVSSWATIRHEPLVLYCGACNPPNQPLPTGNSRS